MSLAAAAEGHKLCCERWGWDRGAEVGDFRLILNVFFSLSVHKVKKVNLLNKSNKIVIGCLEYSYIRPKKGCY